LKLAGEPNIDPGNWWQGIQRLNLTATQGWLIIVLMDGASQDSQEIFDLGLALEVVGIKSGRTISFPLVMVTLNRQRYLVSMLGENSQWVRNIRASGGRAVLHSGSREDIQLEEVPIDQRAPILKANLQIATGARPHVSVNKDAPHVEFEKIAVIIPVFRLISGQKELV
jgi:hypothetical protein